MRARKQLYDHFDLDSDAMFIKMLENTTVSLSNDIRGMLDQSLKVLWNITDAFDEI